MTSKNLQIIPVNAQELFHFMATDNNHRVRKLRCQLRAFAGLPKGSNYPIVLSNEVDSPPTFKGESFSWKTSRGQEIYHPSAYSKVGWSNMVYYKSTYRVSVGINWFCNWLAILDGKQVTIRTTSEIRILY